ncbi:hypothetical protein BSKO_03386 [Bryopsis sp. KO-2023]|nr:hypothetical protein BSKO_03386 [Bryopsis sp. KO-2023]
MNCEGSTEMHIRSWEEFERQGEAVFRADPVGTRFIIKYKHSAGALTVKITDDRVCLVYNTDQESDLERVEKFNLRMMAMMAMGVDAADVETEGEVAVKAKSKKSQQPKQKQRRKT